jgi:nucleoside-diphosphate-sugar epimerase
MPGLPRSWIDFDLYESCNVRATQRLVEAACRQGLTRFVYASTSSVYGRYASGDESLPARPISPYGVTKLAAENLCRAYAEERGLPLVVLRYFSVYGPRQRPDMGYQRFIRALLDGEPLPVCGDGLQVRGNTYVDDCVAATVAAAGAVPGETYNVGGGEAVSVWDVIRKLETITGRSAEIRREPARPGDQRHTCADTSKLTRHLGWRPRVGLDEGLVRQVAWQEAQEHSASLMRRNGEGARV